jgi:hypothetical protein
MLMGARRVTMQISATAPIPLDRAWVEWGDGQRLDLGQEPRWRLQAGQTVELTHVYALASTPYELLVTIEDTDGQQATAVASVTARNSPPQLAVTIAVEEQAVTVTPTAVDPDGEVVNITLYWGGREGLTPGVVSGLPVTHHYPERGGLWDVLTTATDDEGASAAIRQYVALVSVAEAAAAAGHSPGTRCQEQDGDS